MKSWKMKREEVNEAQQGDLADKNTQPKRGKWRRRIKWTLLTLLTLVVLTVAVVIIWLGPIVERYVENHDKEYVGRRLEMDELRLKLFKGHASVDNLTLYEADDSTRFVSIGRVEMDIELTELLDNHVHITRATLRNPSFAVEQHGEEFNFDDMIGFIIAEYLDDADDAEDVEDGEPWLVTIENVEVEGGDLAYYDAELEQAWRLTDVALSTPRLTIGNETSTIAASMVVNDGAQLDGELGLNVESLDFKFDGVLAGFALTDTYKYVKPAVNIESLAGSVAADVVIEGNITDIMAMDIVGELSVEELAIAGPDGANLLSANRVLARVEQLNIAEERYIFDVLQLEGYVTEMRFEEDGSTNFDMLFYGEPEVSITTTAESVGAEMYDVAERVTVTTSDEVAPFSNMTLRIRELRLDDGSLYYADRTMHEPFEYRLRNIDLSCDNFDLMAENTISLNASLEQQGAATLRWTGSLTDFYNQSLLAMFTNVDMQGLSTYVEHFTAFPVTSGNLTFRSQNVVTNGELNGINQLGTYQFNVGQRDRSMDVEYSLPLKLGVYVLTDRNDHIDVDLPITGNIDSPEFSYRKIIMRAIGNLLLKVVAAPFEWMSPDKQDAFRHIDIGVLEPGLTSEQYARLDNMAAALKSDSTIHVRLTQRVNYQRAVQRIADLNLKIAYYNSMQATEGEYLDMLDFSRIAEMRLSGREVIEFADSQLLVRGIDPSHMSSHAKAMALYGDMVDEQLTAIMRHRNRTVEEYMGFQHADIPEGGFALNDVVIEDVRNYSGRDRYTVTLVIDGEEYEIVADEESTDEEMTDDYYDAHALDEEYADEEYTDEEYADEDSSVEEYDEEPTDGIEVEAEDNNVPTDALLEDEATVSEE